MNRNLLIEIICGLLIFLFTYTGLSKLADYNFFKSQLNLYPIINSLKNLIAWALPLFELCLSVFMIFKNTRLKALYASATLLSIFTLYIIVMTMFYKNLPCSCGGVLRYMTWKQHIVFNMTFIGLSIIGIVLIKKENSPKFLLQ